MIGSWFGVVGFKSINCEDLLVYQVPKLNDIKSLEIRYAWSGFLGKNP
jgi:hypothetical protein